MSPESQTNEDAFGALSNDIRSATLHKLKLFEEIRSQTSAPPHLKFWDVVVLSALDAAQKEAYELQLNEKISRGEIPSQFVTYHVIHDPVGVKVGNGGGVLAVMDQLDNIYGSKLSELKVLVLLSGGYSQRLPSSSLLGKIFTCLPMGEPIYQMLELKLAMYIKFPSHMQSGVFVSSADCIELYELSGEEWNFNCKGITALAHPSPIEIGTTHGVYVLKEDDMERLNDVHNGVQNTSQVSSSSYVGSCRRFLHKPSREVMRSAGAVFMRDGEEFVYSDSAYFCAMETALLLLSWYRARGGLKCEIDAYGDFLQALGPEGTIDYCKNTSGVTMVTEELVSTREEVFRALQGTLLNVLMLDKSKFYHIGTTKEYVENFCRDRFFRHEMTFTNRAMLKLNKDIVNNALHSTVVLFHSIVQSAKNIGHSVIVENSKLHENNVIGNNCIISNNIFPNEDIAVPDSSFLHTVIVRGEGEGETRYVCVGFGIEDNVKRCCVRDGDMSVLTYAGMSLDQVFAKMEFKHRAWKEVCPLPNLWNAKLFRGFASPQHAVRDTVAMLRFCRYGEPVMETDDDSSDRVYYSMGDVLALKDLGRVLEMRRELRQEIQTCV